MTRPAGGIPRYRPWSGPAVLSAGFRPFFLMVYAWAALAVPLWLAVFMGRLMLPTAFDAVIWHAHEMIFGFAQAAIAGFLLTAVPNWTGRMPIQGWSLGALALVFLGGRIAMAISAVIGAPLAATIDLAFPLTLLVVLAREIITGRNWRNLPMLVALGLIVLANGLTHLETTGLATTAQVGLRLGIATIVALISLIGGRIIPSFTRNWLVKRGETKLPAPAGKLDAGVMTLTIIALVAWVFFPGSSAIAPLMAVASAANLIRLACWRGCRTAGEPLVWVLHVAFAWLPVGFALMAVSAATRLLPTTAALHSLTGGAITMMIVAVSTRATLGHTGRDLSAGPATTIAYILLATSAAARVTAGYFSDQYLPLLMIAGLAWTVAFLILLGLYAPALLMPRRATA